MALMPIHGDSKVVVKGFVVIVFQTIRGRGDVVCGRLGNLKKSFSLLATAILEILKNFMYG